MPIQQNTYNAMLLGAQAAGIGAGIYASGQQRRAEAAGAAIDEGALKLRMQQEQLAFTQANIADLNNLAETLSAQRAILGARGQASGSGSAAALANKTIAQYGEDKQSRQLNASFRKDYITSMIRLRRANLGSSRAAYGSSLIGQSMNMFSFNSFMPQQTTTTTSGAPRPIDFGSGQIRTNTMRTNYLFGGR